MAKAMHAPRLVDGLSEVDGSTLAQEAAWEGVIVRGPIGAIDAERVEITGSHLRDVRLTGSSLPRLCVRDCVLERCELSGVVAESASLSRCRLVDCRLSGLVLASAVLRDVCFNNCRMDDANLRLTTGESVWFVDCDLTRADFYGVRFGNARIVGCQLDATEFSAAKLAGAAFHGSDLGTIRGATSLRGIVIEPAQVYTLATALLPELGVVVTEAPPE